MMCLPSFVKIGLGIQKLIIWGIHRQHGDPINLLLFIEDKESRPETATLLLN
jgi:hypothetical protein